MRQTYRAAGLLALAVAAITCTDAPTGPGSHRPGFTGARLAMAPNFSSAAARAYGALEAMGISVTQVRIRLRTADGRVARDTTIQYGDSDTLHIQIPVEIQGTEQTFSALIELMDASGVVLFSQTQDVTARAASLPAAPPPTITLEYVGPGATARAITVTPGDLTVRPGVEPVLTAVGTDAAGNPVTNLLLAWTSSDVTLATVTAVGRVATVHGTGRRGTVTITATAPTGLAGSARLAMLPLAARLAVVSGDAQTSVAGRLLAQPLVVELQGVDGGPIPDATVAFRAVSAGAAVGTATATTDASGRASTTLTLGTVAGTYTFEATSGAVTPVTIAATATTAPAVALALVSGDAQVDSTGQTLEPMVVRATNEFGAAVPGAPITWERLVGIGSLVATTATTDADGLASTRYVLGTLASTDTVRAAITGATGAGAAVRFSARAITRLPREIVITAGNGQIGAQGTTLPVPLVAAVTDARGNRLAGVSVQWQSSIAGLVSFGTPTSLTDANGEARTTVTLGTLAGAGVVKAVAGSLVASTTVEVAVGAAANLAAVAGSGPAVVGNQRLLRARVTDAGGNPVSGHLVSWAVTAGGGTLAASTSTTNTLGEADAAWTLGFLVGVQTAVATSTGLNGSPALFTVNAVAGAGSRLRIETQPGAPALNAPSGVILTAQPVVQLTDPSGTPIQQAGVAVTASLADAQATLRGTTTALTDASGRAAFVDLNLLGTAGLGALMVFSATDFTSVTSSTIVIGPGVPATMVAQTLPLSGVVGVALFTPPSVIVRDSSGNPVSGVPVTFAVTSGGGSIGTAAATTDASGAASAGSWVLGVLPGVNTVTATSGTLDGSPAVFTVTGVVGPPTSLKFLTSPLSAPAGTTLSAVSVAVLDASGNVVATSGDSISLVIAGNRGVGLQGTTGARTVNGVARFTDLSIATPGLAYQLDATSGALTPAQSDVFDITNPVQAASLGLLAGQNQLMPIRGMLPKDSVSFIVRDQLERPMPDVTVTLQLGEFSACTLAQQGPFVTDANGVVSTAVTASDSEGACEVTAIVGDLSATSKIGVYADGMTHVWFGGTIEGPRNYDIASNWLTTGAAPRQAVPAATDAPLVPYWESAGTSPVLQAAVELRSLTMSQFAFLDLNGHRLTTSGDLLAPFASLFNGKVLAGGAGVRVSGQFDDLEVGRVDYCNSGDAAALDSLNAKSLRVVCTANIGAQVSADTLDAGGAAKVLMTPASALIVNSGASITGSELSAAGLLYVGQGGATITAAKFDATDRAQVHVAGPMVLGRAGASVNFASGSYLQADSTATFDGGGTLAADAVVLSGTARFTGAGTWLLPRGELQLFGNLDVQSGQLASFQPSGDHLTLIDGLAAQSVTMAAGAGNFGRVHVMNTADVVTFAGNIPVIAGADALRFHLDFGARVTVSSGLLDIAGNVDLGNSAILTVKDSSSFAARSPGAMRLFDNSQLIVDGTATVGSCTKTIFGKPSLNVTIGGRGTINGVPAAAFADLCTP